MRHRSLLWALAALLGLVVAAAVTWATSRLTSQLDVAAQPVSALSRLAPSVPAPPVSATTTTRTDTDTDTHTVTRTETVTRTAHTTRTVTAASTAPPPPNVTPTRTSVTSTTVTHTSTATTHRSTSHDDGGLGGASKPRGGSGGRSRDD